MQSIADIIGPLFEIMATGPDIDAYKEPGDYIGPDGLLICGRCHTPRQCAIEVGAGDAKRKLNQFCLCQCRKAQRDADERDRARLEQRRRLDRLRGASLMTEKMAGYTFDRFERRAENERTYKLLQSYADRFGEMLRKNQGLVLWGPAGSGKTFAACCIANQLLDRGWPVLATSIIKILRADKFGDGDDAFMAAASDAALLVLDDLGAERATDTAIERVYGIIDSRYRDGNPVVITTNLTLAQMQHTDDIRYARIYGRVLEMCYPVEVRGVLWRKESAAARYDEMSSLLGDA